MPDYATLLDAAHRRLQELSDLPFATPQAESQAPLWFTTDAGLAYLAALHRGDDATALDIYDAAFGHALNTWIDLLWQGPSPATKED